jgi:transposase InsO family protein
VCWDCAAAESFFATLKNEMYYRHRFDTRARARFAVAEYIEIFYNRRRLHSRHGYRTRPKPSAITRPEQQPDHDNHEELSTILDTAHTAWIWHFRFDRSPTSFARWRTQPRSSRVAGGAIQASGSRPIHSKSARSAASRSSFFTRCNANIFTPGGLA